MEKISDRSMDKEPEEFFNLVYEEENIKTWLSELFRMLERFFIPNSNLHGALSLPELTHIFNEIEIPKRGSALKKVIGEVREKIIPNSVKVWSPFYIGHMISPIPNFMILLDILISLLNQNQVKIETARASSFVERELLAWFHRLIYEKDETFYRKNIQNPEVSFGNITSDGTIANLTAFLVAREKAFPRAQGFSGIRHMGYNEGLRHHGYRRGVILVSKRGHYSIKKSANILGIGEKNVASVGVDLKNRIDLKRLKRKIKEIQKEKESKIISIVGIAGTTETGNIDNLEELATISRDIGTHFHVDACWGGGILLSEEYRDKLKGIELADSVSLDAHKLLFCPMTMGMVLFRDEKDMNLIRQYADYIIRPGSVDMGRFTLEGSRPFSCLRPWVSLKVFGREGYGKIFKKAFENTHTFKEIVNESKNFELLNMPELFIVNYRFIPQYLKENMQRWKKEGSRSKLREINNVLNELNTILHKDIRRDGFTFVSRTTLESTPYRPQKIVVLRAILINPLIEDNVLKDIIKRQDRLGSELFRDYRSKIESICIE